jgi:hypothetical protein
MHLLAIAAVLVALSALDLAQAQRLDLLHLDHYNSPFAKPHQTHTERVVAALERSHKRVQRFQKTSDDLTGASSIASWTQGEYIMEVAIGTPPQKQVAIVDTGSDLVWFQCGCSTYSDTELGTCYNQTDPVFNLTASSSFAITSCTDPVCSGPFHFVPSRGGHSLPLRLFLRGWRVYRRFAG